VSYEEAFEAYKRDDCVKALELLRSADYLPPEGRQLCQEIQSKIAHLSSLEVYRDKCEWIATQVPIMRLTWEVFRLRWLITQVKHLAGLGYSTLADVGCQKGEMTVWFGRHCPELQRIVGVDIAPTCVRAARGNPGNTPNIEYVEAAASDLPFEDSEFSLVVLSGLLEHVIDPDAVLREARRVCVKGGFILGNTPLGGYEYWPEKFADPKEDAAHNPPIVRDFRSHVRCWNPHEHLQYEAEVTIAYNDQTGDPDLPFACQGTKTGEWCFMFRNVKE
jgi:SAM-dependent methyltransferase